MNMIAEYRELVSEYQSGMITWTEMTSKSMDLLFQSDSRDILWNELSESIRREIIEVLEEFDENAEPFALRPSNAIEVKLRLTDLKSWMRLR